MTSVSSARVLEGGYPPPTVGTFSKIIVSKSHFRAFKNHFLRGKTEPQNLCLQQHDIKQNDNNNDDL